MLWRWFRLRGKDGRIVRGGYLGLVDYNNGNFDYNGMGGLRMRVSRWRRRRVTIQLIVSHARIQFKLKQLDFLTMTLAYR